MDPRDVIIRPWITEKSTEEIEDNKYTFVVDKKANKTQIKQAVEKLFEADVKKVRTMNMTGKPKRLGRYEGRRPDWKKAIVVLKEDSKPIKIFE
ncbi:50S ribosomal protein L23 [Natranaerofaba carboxydovora]|uniref:50S ribosomal protein L23 n=1 Tax=Natranaerofaba carboxydovora TaxID=2742683 RepID=UPI001F136E36|nr:50S ribosomal protein L23 [Natranaerofaba carboxydovora]UMZ75395.1 50S ribosomal protein L23 [Natranaerofaba carboxydovora]